MIPPIGKIVSPAVGLWRNAEPSHLSRDIAAVPGGLHQDILVGIDTDAIPHLFCKDDHDLYFAQGYVTARDRLWQMELQVRTASGRLSEIFGGQVLGRDMFIRRAGLLYAAERALDSAMKDTDTRMMLQGYTDGVNAFIHGLSEKDYPLEYKLFDCRPQEWRPLNSLLIMKLMAETLTSGESEFGMTNALAVLGKDTMNSLFSHPMQGDEPVIPGSAKTLRSLPSRPSPAELAGSNNWAVAGRRTANGFPLLANDPHLRLTLPSTWYQAQLQAPGCDVYGVSIPGVPGIAIGFNRNIAWGETNAAADVMDWYRVRFKDGSMRQYWHDGKWDPTVRHIEKYRLNNGRVFFDTVFFTRQGPVVYDGISHKKPGLLKPAGVLEGFAVRWTMHDVSNDLKTIYLLNRAKNFEDYRAAVAWLNCPAQNFVYAGRDNNIAMTSSGKFPIRGSRQGEFVLDGNVSDDDWQGWIPMDQDPFVKNPDRGFVSSANQVLTGPDYRYSIPGHYSLPYRASRINSRLASMNSANVDSFRLLQFDTYSPMAAETLPQLLERLDRKNIRDGGDPLDELAKWNYTFEKNSKAATLFTAWWEELHRAIWQDDMERGGTALPWPDYRKTAFLILHDTSSHWIDDITTPEKETFSDVVNASFQKALYELRRRIGPFGDNWNWGNSRSLTIPYIGNLPSLGIRFKNADGAPNTIDALSDRFGPSWRMVVELGPMVTGYGILPGGQSGNPGSKYYDNLFQTWLQGRLNVLKFPASMDDMKGQVQYTLQLKK
jgi:penicillin amidase